MNEQMERIGNQLLKNAELVSIVALAAILAGVGFLWWRDAQGFTLPPGPSPSPMPLTASLPNAKFDRVAGQVLTGKTDINADDRARRLVQLNMFDARSVEAQRERDRAFAGQFQGAEQAFNAGNLDAAEQAVDAILKQNALHSGATELKRKISAARVPVPTPTPAEGTPPVDGGNL